MSRSDPNLVRDYNESSAGARLAINGSLLENFAATKIDISNQGFAIKEIDEGYVVRIKGDPKNFSGEAVGVKAELDLGREKDFVKIVFKEGRIADMDSISRSEAESMVAPTAYNVFSTLVAKAVGGVQSIWR